MYQKVLVPLDGSELAECALNHVKSLSKDGFLGEITVLNVMKVDIPWLSSEDEREHRQFDINKVRERVSNASQKYLADVKSRLASEGFEVKTESLEANRPAQAIIAYALEKGIDMIAIATHGYTGMKGMMMGSVALSVIHQSHVPVLLIRPEACRV